MVAILLVVLLAGCVRVASTAYSSATDERTLAQQAEDTRLSAKVKRGLLDTGVKNALALDVFCHQGVVVLAGVVDSPAKIDRFLGHARAVEGVVAVKSFIQLKSP